MSTLLVIIPDAISTIIAKGEYQPRYYNPGNLFDEVHILMTCKDVVKTSDMQHTVGTARLFIHSVPDPSGIIYNSPFFKPWMLNPKAAFLLSLFKKHFMRQLDDWAGEVVNITRQIKPDLIRCHANDYNAYAAGKIKEQLGIPYVVSLHINPDVNPRRRVLDSNAPWQERLFANIFEPVEEIGLKSADRVLPVYSPIVAYLKRLGCENYEIAYNVLSDHVEEKKTYALHHPVRLISVGRHFPLKNPENIIRAVADMQDVELTLVGDGPLQEPLMQQVKDAHLEQKVLLRPSIPNRELCHMLPEYDIFVVHTEHWEISKALLEALLTGMPVLMNYREGTGGDPEELRGADFILQTRNTPEGYREGLQRLINDPKYREELGRKAFKHARENWAPEITEAKYAKIYQQVMDGNRLNE